MANVNHPSDVPQQTTVWANLFVPQSDEWDPNADTPGTYDETQYQDIPTAEPVSEQYGQALSGTVPDVRSNLITDVFRPGAVPMPTPPVQHHIVETVEVGSDAVRARTVRVVGNVTETELLPQDDRRIRALIKVVTSTSVIIVGPARQGGNPTFTAVPTGPANWYYQATGDGSLEVKATAAVSAYGTSATGAVDVCVWEELTVKGNQPGLAV